MNKKKRIQSIYRNRFILIILLMGVIVTFKGYDFYNVFQIIRSNQVSKLSDFEKYQKSNQEFAIASFIEMNYTDIDLLVTDEKQDILYKGYLVEIEDGYFLVFRDENSSSAPSNFIISKAWVNYDNMSIFYNLVVDYMVTTSELDRQDVEKLIFPFVYLDVEKIIYNQLPYTVLWGGILTILLIYAIVTLASYQGGWTIEDYLYRKKWYMDDSLILFHNKKWTLSENSLTYHGFRFLHFNIQEFQKVSFASGAIRLILKNQKITIRANESLIKKLKESWGIDSQEG